jgi:hypothetical protein
MFLFFTIYLLSNTYKYDAKYNDAVTNATNAAYKQSMAEPNFLQVKNAAQDKGTRLIHNAGMDIPVTIGTAIVPVLIYKKVRVKSGNFVFEGTTTTKQITWSIQF